MFCILTLTLSRYINRFSLLELINRRPSITNRKRVLRLLLCEYCNNWYGDTQFDSIIFRFRPVILSTEVR